MENCDYYSCECSRDIELAKIFGFKGHSFPVYPNTGGFDPEIIATFRNRSVPTAQRKVIMFKGYQGWAGRALVGIRALEKCADLISEYKIIIYSAAGADDIMISATLLSINTGVAVEILPSGTPHEKIMEYHSQARISIGLSIGDAISTSLLEAMAMGSFPIQSCTACASEWFTDGVSGLIVTPEDPEIVEKAIRKALLEDDLVNSAAEINLSKIINDANFTKLQEKTIFSYRKVLHV
jgi:glycosyltransferase involved in cell wall biosynthesis